MSRLRSLPPAHPQDPLEAVRRTCTSLEGELMIAVRDVQALRFALLPLLPPAQLLPALWASEEATFPLALFDALEGLAAEGLCLALALTRQVLATTEANPEGRYVDPAALWDEYETLCPQPGTGLEEELS
ncbi:MAG: hypothetical protein U0002_10845 [Thermoanaerobaculia bacterium]